MVAQAEFNRVIAAIEDLIHREIGALRARVREVGRGEVALDVGDFFADDEPVGHAEPARLGQKRGGITAGEDDALALIALFVAAGFRILPGGAA